MPGFHPYLSLDVRDLDRNTCQKPSTAPQKKLIFKSTFGICLEGLWGHVLGVFENVFGTFVGHFWGYSGRCVEVV